MNDSQLQQIETLAHQTMNYHFKVWGFGEGIALEALWDAAQVTQNMQYRAYVLDLFENWLRRPLTEADHSAPGALLLNAYQETADSRYIDRAIELANHMLALPTAATGAAFHRPHHPEFHSYIYVDCMEVDAPFLCKLAAVTGGNQYYDAAVHQILSYCALLQDDASGLFFHQYDGATGKVNGAFWGRGNGWALLGLLKTLLLLPETHTNYPLLKRRLLRLIEALTKYQFPDGSWSTVLDKPNTYSESSLVAMFGFGILLAIEKKLVDDKYLNVVDSAWSAMSRNIVNGLLEGVSVATPPGIAMHYASVTTGSGFPWGQGPALLFALNYHN